jgi:WD40 repeat protein
MGSRRTARIWDAETGWLIAVLECHSDKIWSALFSPDGRRVVMASGDGRTHIWDVAGTEIIVRFRHIVLAAPSRGVSDSVPLTSAPT